MSKTVDQRVVQMEFDNKNFEKNVNQSMSTLDKLKKFLSFGKETKSLEELQRQADRTKFNGMANAVEGLAEKFRGLEMLGTVAFMRLANAAVTYGANIVKSLTIGPISEGYADYGRKLTSVQTITNATGKSIEEVNKYFRQLDTYADLTIYNLDDMTSSLAKFTNAGVDLDQSVPAIKGIANMVALAGQDANAAQIAMYNLSQSIAGGFLTTMDYKSLNLANVATKEWKENMAAGATAAGTLKKNLDGTYTVLSTKKNYNLQQLFSEGLSDQWATTNVMLDVLGKYGDEETEIGKKAQAAAQDVKSFGMMMDTLKASVGTGWTDTFEILIGNLEESKALFTPLSNALSGFFDKMSEARNTMLQEWKDNGGRDDLIEGFKNLFGAIGTIIKPIQEAFRDIFPPMTGKRLAELTAKFKEFTANLKISDETAEKIKNTFKGFFSVVKAGINIVVMLGKVAWNILGVFKPLVGGILSATSAFGKWLEKTTKVVRDSQVINKVLTTIVDTLKMVTKKIGEFIKDTLKFENIVAFFKTIWKIVTSVALGIAKVFGQLLRNGDFKAAIDLFNAGLVSAGLLGIIKMIKNFGSATKNLSGFMKGLKEVVGGVGELLGAFTQQVQSKTLMNIAKAVAILAVSLLVLSLIPADKIAQSLGAMTAVIAQLMIAFKVLTKIAPDMKKSFAALLSMVGIATAVFILASALKKISSLDMGQIITSLVGLGGAMAILMAGMKLMTTGKGLRAPIGMMFLAASLYILAGALKKLSGLNLWEIGKSLLALSVSLKVMSKAMAAMPEKGNVGRGVGLMILAATLLVVGEAMKKIAGLSWGEIIKSLGAIGVCLWMMTAMTKALPTEGLFVKSMAINNIVGSLVVVAVALVIAAYAMRKLAEMSWDEIGRSLTAMGVALTLMVAACAIMAKTGGKAGGLLVASAALVIFAMGMKSLASIGWGGLIVALAAITIGITALVVAANLLAPLAPVLLAVAGAMALFGVGVAAFGVGLILIASGITALGIALATGATMIIAGLSAIILGILGMLPEIVKIAVLFLKGLALGIIELAPIIAQAIGTLIYEAIKMLADYVPMIVTVFLDLFINVFRALTDRVPELIVSAVEFLEAVFRGFIQAFKIMDPAVFLEGIKAIGLLTTAFLMMAALTLLFPKALLGVLAFGVLVAELTIVLAVLGKLLGGKGMEGDILAAGDVLMAVGTAIGQFIGGLIGGVSAGVSGSMPKIAKNLSEFMTELQPFLQMMSAVDPSVLGKVILLSAAILVLSAANFISGLANLLSFGQSLPKLGKQLGEFGEAITPFTNMAATITPNMMKGVNALTGAIIALTAANLIKGISNFLLGGNSFEKFGAEIASLGTGMKTFVKNLGNFKDGQVKTIEAACSAIKILAEASKKIPNEGGVWGWLAGDNSIGKFAAYLPDVGTHLAKFVSNLGSFDTDQIKTVEAASSAIVKLAEAGKQIPNEGGVWGWIAGDNSIGKFANHLPDLGKHLAAFVVELGTFDKAQVESAGFAAEAIAVMAQAASQIPNGWGLVSLFTGNNDISTFGKKLPSVATSLKGFVDNLKGMTKEQIEVAGFAGEAIAKLAKAAQDVPNSSGLVNLFTGDNDFSKFGDKLPAVGTGLRGFVDNLKEFTPDNVTAADCAGRAIAALATAASQIPGDKANWIEAIVGDKNIDTFAAKLPTVATYLAQFVANLTKEGTVFDESKVGIVDCAGRAIAALAGAAKDIPADRADWIESIVGNKDISLFASKLPEVGTGIAGFVANLTKEGGSFDEAKVTTVDCAARALASLADAGKNLPKDGGAWQWLTGSQDIEEFAKKLPGVGEALAGFMGKLGDFSQIQVDTVNAAVNALWALSNFGNIDTGKMNSALEAVSSKIGTFGSKLSEFTEGMKNVSPEDLDAAADKIYKVQDMLSKVADTSIESLNTFGESLVKIGTESMKKFVEAFNGEDPKTQATNGIKDLIMAMLTAAESKRSELVDKFGSLVDSALTNLTNTTFANKVKEAGKNFAQGFANGINENTYLARDAGTNLGNAAYQAAKKSIDAHSPSRKSYKLGEFFGQGFVNAVNVYSKLVYNQSYGMGELAVAGINDSVSHMGGFFDDIGDPTIKPVVDLTEVTNGAKKISGMFGNVNLGANLNAISVGMSRNRQNGKNDDVVDAIDKLGSSIGSKTGDTYNINGVTYGADGEISEAIGVLIRAANVERRT